MNTFIYSPTYANVSPSQPSDKSCSEIFVLCSVSTLKNKQKPFRLCPIINTPDTSCPVSSLSWSTTGVQTTQRSKLYYSNGESYIAPSEEVYTFFQRQCRIIKCFSSRGRYVFLSFVNGAVYPTHIKYDRPNH